MQAHTRGDGGQPVDIRRFRDPLAFLAEEHLRQRKVCADLDILALPGGGDRALAAAVLAHIEHEMPAHVLDEEEDLFPLLRRRAEPEDEIDATLSRLDQDHAKGERLAEPAKACLADMAARGCAAVGDARACLAELAAHERRHLIVENAIILPLARTRLTETDLRTLALRMAARRGLNLAGGTDEDT